MIFGQGSRKSCWKCREERSEVVSVVTNRWTRRRKDEKALGVEGMKNDGEARRGTGKTPGATVRVQ